LKKLKNDGIIEQIDLLFLDHVEDLYVADLKVVEELGLLKSGALVLADNVVRPGAPQYVEYVRGNARYSSHGVQALIMPGEMEVSGLSFVSGFALKGADLGL
jgi:catechol O-methyltransferase